MAERDLGSILEGETSFAWPVILTDLAGNKSIIPEYDLDGNVTNNPLKGSVGDISTSIDPDTGQIVAGRQSSVALRISSVLAVAGFTSLPEGIEDQEQKPWQVSFKDLEGNDYNFKVMEGAPDRTSGIINLFLEIYKP